MFWSFIHLVDIYKKSLWCLSELNTDLYCLSYGQYYTSARTNLGSDCYASIPRRRRKTGKIYFRPSPLAYIISPNLPISLRCWFCSRPPYNKKVSSIGLKVHFNLSCFKSGFSDVEPILNRSEVVRLVPWTTRYEMTVVCAPCVVSCIIGTIW